MIVLEEEEEEGLGVTICHEEVRLSTGVREDFNDCVGCDSCHDSKKSPRSPREQSQLENKAYETLHSSTPLKLK